MQIRICLTGSPPGLVTQHELQRNISECLSIATSRCNMETQDLQNDRNCSRVTPILNICKRGEGEGFTSYVKRSSGIALFAASENRSLTCSGCSECLHSLQSPSCTSHQYNIRKCHIRLLWELTDIPSTIQESKTGSISQIRELLIAASRYAAEVEDVVSHPNFAHTRDQN